VIAADTNVIVRLPTGDEPQQAAKAHRLFETEMVFLSTTILLEAEWVLRRLYRLERTAIIRALDALISLSNVRCEDESVVRQALVWSQAGVDLADALHLAARRNCERFATFDRALLKPAAACGVSVSEP
jgi:predicted nucleic-acid-binding protein